MIKKLGVLITQLLRSDLSSFIHRAFQTVAPGEPYLDNWHISAIAHRLQECIDGKVTRLIITLPPRSGKSIAVSVAFVAYLLGRDPTKQVICASYSKDLAFLHSRDCRAVMDADWYQDVFPYTRFDPDKNSEGEFYTDQRGFRLATSVGGTLTGRGGDYIIVDDSLKPDEAYSEAARSKVNQWYSNTLVSRLNNKAKGVIIIVQQRLHEDDLVGYLLDKDPDGWVHLNLQAIATEPQRIPIGDGVWHERREGDVLHPERESLKQLMAMKAIMGPATFEAQYQQTPTPREGVIVNPAWFGAYEDAQLPSTFDRVVQSWDTANTVSELSNYSVCTTWGVLGPKVYLLHVFRKRLTYPELKRAVREQFLTFKASVVLIEDRASGTQLIQELIDDGVHGVQGIGPEGDKEMRLNAQTATMANGFVYLPASAPWRDDYLHEMASFPNGKYSDQVDSTSQALEWIKMTGRTPALLLFYEEKSKEVSRPHIDPFIRLRAPLSRRQRMNW